MIKLRRRNPVTEMARLGSLAGSKLTRTRGSRKEWFVGVFVVAPRKPHVVLLTASQWGWGPRRGT
jgi:hypothetical protein